MRIIGGKNKNYRFKFPKNLKVRPTTDFCKENLFNILNNYIDFDEISVLDLYSGSGNISYEFISRGSHVTSIDNNYKCIRFIEKNMILLNTDKFKVQKIDCINFLKENKNKYDIIFADPPFNYDEKYYEHLINLIFEKKTIKIEGTLILEHNKFLNFKNSNYFYMSRKYGDINFSFFKYLKK